MSAADTTVENTSGGRAREFTRYFVQFADGYVAGIDSHYLELVD